MCINIGDQFARAAVYGRYKVIPLHAEIIAQGEKIGFDFMGSIIWQKKTTMNPSGGAVVMGSYPYPPNGIVELDYEFILIFKKPGAGRKVLKEVKEASKLSKEEWKEYFYGHWRFGGARQLGHEAMFPEELPRRLIRMFTFAGDTVLDPFLGSGTTVKVALELGRNSIGYEINDHYLEIIEKKIGVNDILPFLSPDIQVIQRTNREDRLPEIDYLPGIQDANPLLDTGARPRDPLFKVAQIISADKLRLDTGQIVKFLGVKIDHEKETIAYLNKQLLAKTIILKNNTGQAGDNILAAYIYLKNKIFINAYLIKSGLGSPDLAVNHKLKQKFITIWQERAINRPTSDRNNHKSMSSL